MRTLRIAALALIAIISPTLSLAAPDPGVPGVPGGPRVRPYDTRSASLLLEGLRRSETLRAIVDELESRHVIVYIEMQRLKKGLAGRLALMSSTPQFRYVRIAIDPELSAPIALATLGHELQHALEVANESSVVDDKTLEDFYRSTGISMPAHGNSWDTAAAREVGFEIRREVADGSAIQLTARAERLDPLEWAIEYRQARESMR